PDRTTMRKAFPEVPAESGSMGVQGLPSEFLRTTAQCLDWNLDHDSFDVGKVHRSVRHDLWAANLQIRDTEL
ncbi:MAG: hypothetical protein KDA96_24055, partial [Planctomycetaceae bacterium]|nr:hypothetical protein [Planctomycetaceae bacterium]